MASLGQFVQTFHFLLSRTALEKKNETKEKKEMNYSYVLIKTI